MDYNRIRLDEIKEVEFISISVVLLTHFPIPSKNLENFLYLYEYLTLNIL